MNCNLEIAKGSDLKVSLPLYDKTGALIDATSFSKLIVVVTHANGSIIDKFSKNTSAGFNPIDMTLASSGTIKVHLLSSKTLAATTGKLFATVHGVMPDISATDDTVLDYVSVNNYLCNIIDSPTVGIALP